MSKVSHYWQFHQLNSQGKITVTIIDEAKLFIETHCADLINQNPFSDIAMQRRLVELMKTYPVAEICLRCYISEQIKQGCLKLKRQFGENHQFNEFDLYPLVLDDILGKSKETGYISLATKILQDFNPHKASLSTWTNRLLRSDPELTKFLLERDVYLISDWAILNDTKPRQLQRILLDFHNLSQSTLDQCITLLQAYHHVYRLERLSQRKSGGKGKCQPPLASQLEKIVELGKLSLTSAEVLTELEGLAELLRQYRIAIKIKKAKQVSWDNQGNADIEYNPIEYQLEQKQLRDSEDLAELAQQEFLNRYRQQFLVSLETAISAVISRWQSKQKEAKKSQFITALKAYHCQGFSMTEIAPLIGLKKQYEVTRLLKLKDFRFDIQQEMLGILTEQIQFLASAYNDPNQLVQREQQIAIALEEQVANVIQEAKNEDRTNRKQPFKNILAQYICSYLDQLNQ